MMVNCSLLQVLSIILLLLPSHVLGELREFPSCTGQLRVCDDFEDPYHLNNLKVTQYCIPNQLERKTVFLTGAAWESAKYNLWIAQIILSEVLQIPVKIVNVNGGSTNLYYYDNQKLDVPDGRVYSWDALHIANSMTMDCNPSYLDHFVEDPEDLTKVGCTENCRPCAHAILEVWPSGQKENLNKYAAELRTIEYGGNLGVVGEVGWWVTKQALDKEPLLSSYRGLREPSATKVFREPVPFGVFCNTTYDDWSWVVSSMSPSALDVTNPSHFCHFFFVYALNMEHELPYRRNDPTYFDVRREQVNRCASLISGTGFLFYDLCKRYWIVPSDIYYALPSVGTDLVRKGYGPNDFLYRGYFFPESTGSAPGTLQTAACPVEDVMPLSKANKLFDKWDNNTYGEEGYIRWKNFDRDIIHSHGLAISPRNMPDDVEDVLEVRGRLAQTHPNESSPILFYSHRPNRIFRRHLYDRVDEEWGGYHGPEFELAKVQLPEYHESCDENRRSYKDRCSPETLDSLFSSPPAQCGYDQEIMYKIFSTKLQHYNPEAYYLLRRFEMTTNHQEHLLAVNEYDSVYKELNPAFRARTIACDWVRNNTDLWKGWLPPTAYKRRCLGEVGDPLVQDVEVVECSGHGTCIQHPQVEFSFPNAGVCQCTEGYQGDDCSGLVVPTLINVSFTSIPFYVVLSLTSLTFVQTLRYSYMVYDNPKSTVFKVSNRLFIYCNLASVLMGLSGVFLWVGQNTVWHCIARPILLGFPYVLSMASIFVKVFRKKIKRAVNDEDLKQLVGFACSVVLALFLVWFVFFTPIARDIRLEDQVWFKYSACIYGENLSAFVALLFVFSALLSVVTIYLAYDIRWMPSYFRETYDLIRTSTILFVNAMVGIVLASYFTSPMELQKFICISSIILCNCWVILGLLIRPKVYVHVKKPELNNMRDGLYRPRGEGDEQIFGLDEETRKKMTKTIYRFFPFKRCFRRSSKVSYEEIGTGSEEPKPGTGKAPRTDSKHANNSKARLGINREIQSKRLVQNPAGRSTNVLTKPSTNDMKRNASSGGFAQPTDNVEDLNKKRTSELAYRSPEMIVLMEKKYRQAVEVNKQLMTILEEHHIDPETGDMDKDYNQVIHAMEEKQLEEIAMMDELYQHEMAELENEMREERAAMRQKLRDAKVEMNNRHKQAMASVKEQAKERADKLIEIQSKTQKLENALKETLPNVDSFLLSKNLDQYITAFEENGVQSFHELLLMEESEFLEMGMKTGHIRKLQNALKVYQPAVAPKRFPGSPTRTKALEDLAPSTTAIVSNVWKPAIDKKSGKKYWYNKALNKSVWKKPKDLNSNSSEPNGPGTSAMTPQENETVDDEKSNQEVENIPDAPADQEVDTPDIDGQRGEGIPEGLLDDNEKPEEGENDACNNDSNGKEIDKGEGDASDLEQIILKDEQNK